jgi:hypothetical protein
MILRVITSQMAQARPAKMKQQIRQSLRSLQPARSFHPN